LWQRPERLRRLQHLGHEVDRDSRGLIAGNRRGVVFRPPAPP
jgi:hypothetical protein